MTEWGPLFTRFYHGVLPWELERFTIRQVHAYIAFIQQHQKAQQEQQRG